MNHSKKDSYRIIWGNGQWPIPAALLVAVALNIAPLAQGAGNVAVCDEPHLLSALAGGGVVKFFCSGTISLTQPIQLLAGTSTTIDGLLQFPVARQPTFVTIVPGGPVNTGGILVPSGATLNLQNVIIAGMNPAGVFGAAVNNAGSLNVSGCQFLNNRPPFACSPNESCGMGGAIGNTGTLNVVNSVFSGNAATSGGAIFNVGLATVWNSSFAGNGALDGGAIFNGDFDGNGTVTVFYSSFSNTSTLPSNEGDHSGGAIFNQGTLRVTASSFSNNNVLDDGKGGGAIYNDGTFATATADITGSTFEANSAPAGGALFNNFGVLKISNSTFNQNDSGGSGSDTINNNGGTVSAIFSTFDGIRSNILSSLESSMVSLENSIVFTEFLGAPSCTGVGFVDAGYNLERGNDCNFLDHGSLDTDPLLSPLAYNGGPTKTRLPLSGSPVIDKIPIGVNGCPTGPFFTLDQRGVARPQGPACDIGAVEAGNPLIPQSSNGCIGFYSGDYIGDLFTAIGTSCAFIGGSISGNIHLQGGSLSLSYTTVNGNIEATGGSFSIGPSTTINGNLEIHDYPPTPVTPNVVCGANINGNVHVHDNAAAMAVGAGLFSACGGNIIGGDLQIHNNTAPAQVLNNSVTGTLDVHNNTANVQAVGNTVTGTLTCFNNSSITGGPNLDSNQAQGQCFQIQATTP